MDNDQITKNQTEKNYQHYHQKKRLFIGIIIIIIVAFLSFWIGVTTSQLREFNCHHYNQRMNFSNYSQLNNNYGPNFSSNSVKLSGVVTSIKNNQITLIGDGTTNTINLSPNVIYQNATKLQINDSVIIYGQYLNNQLVANTIEVNP